MNKSLVFDDISYYMFGLNNSPLTGFVFLTSSPKEQRFFQNRAFAVNPMF